MRYTRVRIFPNVAFDLFNPGVGVFDNGSLKKKSFFPDRILRGLSHISIDITSAFLSGIIMLLFVLYGLPSLLSFISACKCCYRCFVVVMLKNTIGSHTSQNIPQKEKTSYRHFLCTEGGENGVGDENRNEVGQPLIALCRNDEHQRLHV